MTNRHEIMILYVEMESDLYVRYEFIKSNYNGKYKL